MNRVPLPRPYYSVVLRPDMYSTVEYEAKLKRRGKNERENMCRMTLGPEHVVELVGLVALAFREFYFLSLSH